MDHITYDRETCGYVSVTVPRVVADLISPEDPRIAQRREAVALLTAEIQGHPKDWGVWPDRRALHLLASRLLEMRRRVRFCQIEEAREVAAL
jgi:hypothetical protein